MAVGVVGEVRVNAGHYLGHQFHHPWRRGALAGRGRQRSQKVASEGPLRGQQVAHPELQIEGVDSVRRHLPQAPIYE